MIVFDLDGTLVDTSADIVRVVNDVLAERDLLALPAEEVMRHVGYGTPQLLAAVLGRDPDEDEVQWARRRFVELYSREPVRDSRMYPAARETLRALAGAHPMAVVSNKAGRLVRATVEAMGIDELFEPVLGGDDVAEIKPAPDGVLAALAARGARPADAVMVGDMHLDVAAGRRAGTRTVHAAYGFGELADGDPVPDRRIHRFDELPGVLRTLSADATPRG
jgi:phosphoglycolate phosphatase